MYLMTPFSELANQELINMEDMKKIISEVEVEVLTEPGKPEIKTEWGYIRAQMKDGKEDTLAIYTSIEKADAELENIAQALEAGAKVYRLTEDPDVIPKMDKNIAALDAAEIDAED